MQQEKQEKSSIKHIILVLSGKGGVGKSTVSANLALSLVEKGHKVGLLDVDLTGPSIPKIFGLEHQTVHQSSMGWLPVYTDATRRLGVMSIGFLLTNQDDAVVWRGPKKTAMIRQFIQDVAWGSDLDYLIVDTPPGTSDEHISVVEYLKSYPLDGAVIVTTPQKVSLIDVKKEINFAKTVELNVIGLIENMSGFICPNCSSCSNIFSKGGGEALAKEMNVPFLGAIPIDPNLTRLVESRKEGSLYQQVFKESLVYSYFAQMLSSITGHH